MAPASWPNAMRIADRSQRLLRLARLALQVARLPVARLHFERHLDPEHVAATYANFTRPHPRFRLVRNKSLGIALVDLCRYPTRDAYLATVRRKDHAAHHGKRARARGYRLREIDRNDYVDEIHAINTSLDTRQGRPMDETYLSKAEHYEKRNHFQYFGVVNAEGKLMAYCNIVRLGNFAATDRLLGYRNNDGTMYLLVLEIICRLIDEGRLQYFMYDTYLGAKEGLRNFKKRLGFQPYRVRYSMS
jgi:hypothetical protein